MLEPPTGRSRDFFASAGENAAFPGQGERLVCVWVDYNAGRLHIELGREPDMSPNARDLDE